MQECKSTRKLGRAPSNPSEMIKKSKSTLKWEIPPLNALHSKLIGT